MNLESICQTLIKISTAGAGAGYFEEAEDVLRSLIKAVPDSIAPPIALINTKILAGDHESASRLIEKYKRMDCYDPDDPTLDMLEVFLNLMKGDNQSATNLLSTVNADNNPLAQKTMRVLVDKIQ